MTLFYYNRMNCMELLVRDLNFNFFGSKGRVILNFSILRNPNCAQNRKLYKNVNICILKCHMEV